MSVSSVSAAPAVTNVKPVEVQLVPVRPDDKDKDDSRVAPPPPRAALPPGQGTRIDQFA